MALVALLISIWLAIVAWRRRQQTVPGWKALAWGAASVSEAIARSLGVEREPTLTRYVVANLSEETTLDITRARTELGFKPRYNFRDAPLD